MRTIQLKKIELVNFKGIKSLTIEFEKNTDIYGKNEAGKTTIFDAWTWVLFGKDSQNRTDFEIKTLDKNNKAIEQINHEVIATIFVDGEETILRKVLVEKWQKKKGSIKQELTGNTTEHYCNGVPLATAREYQEVVNKICNENVFKLITNPSAFMALKWQDRREVLVKIADKVTDKELATGNREFESLVFNLSNNKTLEQYSLEIQASIKKAKQDLAAIPTRIDEVVRSKSEGVDFKQLQNIIDVKTAELEEIEKSILDKSGLYDKELEEINKTKSKANEIRNWLQIEESVLKNNAKKEVEKQTAELNNLKAKITEQENKVQEAENGLVTLGIKIELIEEEIKTTTKTIDLKREEWKKRNAEVLEFDEECFNCPTCKRLFDTADIEEKKTKLHADFITQKQADLKTISEGAKKMQEVIESQKKELQTLQTRIENGKEFVKNAKEESDNLKKQLEQETAKISDQPTADELYFLLLKDCTIYHEKEAELRKIEAEIIDVPQIDYKDLIEKKKQLTEEIKELNAKMHKKDQNKVADDRIKQLEAEQEILSQQILNVERTQFIIDNFNKVKTEHLENSINSKLKICKFKMFDRLINGGEIPVCEAILNGVSYNDVNTAGKLNIGLDIINMLCEYYQVSAPVIIDNRESVTDIIECNSQIINLIVSPEDKALRIETRKNELILN